MPECTNHWHRNPGALVRCPRCNMTISEWRASRHEPEREQESEEERPGPINSGSRVQAKLFSNEYPPAAIDEMNTWLNKVMQDGRVNVLNCESQVWPPHRNHEGADVSPMFMLTIFYVVRG